MRKYYILIVALIMLLAGCRQKETAHLTQKIFLFKDTDGLYQYDPATNSEKIIYKTGGIFADEHYELLHDTLTFGLKGKAVYTKVKNDDERINFINTYISVDIKTAKSWRSKTIAYEYTYRSSPQLKITCFNTKGKKTRQYDSSIKISGEIHSFKGIQFSYDSIRFYSKSTVGNTSVFSLEGSLYIVNKKDTSVLVKYDDYFDMKFGSGYLEPQIDPTGTYAIFIYLPGLFYYNERAVLKKVDLKTKKVSTIKEGEFSDTRFSDDGNFLLFKRNKGQMEKQPGNAAIYILNLGTLEEQKIGEAEPAFWVKEH